MTRYKVRKGPLHPSAPVGKFLLHAQLSLRSSLLMSPEQRGAIEAPFDHRGSLLTFHQKSLAVMYAFHFKLEARLQHATF
jgi:hypothetical protein